MSGGRVRFEMKLKQEIMEEIIATENERSSGFNKILEKYYDLIFAKISKSIMEEVPEGEFLSIKEFQDELIECLKNTLKTAEEAQCFEFCAIIKKDLEEGFDDSWDDVDPIEYKTRCLNL